MRDQFKNDYASRDQEVMSYLNGRMSEGRDIAKRIQMRLQKIKLEPQSTIRRNKLLRLFQQEMINAGKVDDMSYFKVMEIDLDKSHQAEVNAALA